MLGDGLEAHYSIKGMVAGRPDMGQAGCSRDSMATLPIAITPMNTSNKNKCSTNEEHYRIGSPFFTISWT